MIGIRSFVIFISLGISIAGFSQSSQGSQEKIRVKKVIPPFKRNIISASIGVGKYSSEIFENLYAVGLTTHTFKYTRRFSPRFGMSVYRTGSRTKDILNLDIKTKHTGFAFRFTSSAERALQFYFGPGMGIGKYPEYSTSYTDLYGNYLYNGPLTLQDTYRYLDLMGEAGFEYHFNQPFLVSIGSQFFINIEGYWNYTLSAGIGLKF